MRKPLYQQVKDWLEERKSIYERYMPQGAFFSDNVWHIQNDDGTFREVDFNNSSEISLVLNHAYYMGCVAGSKWFLYR